MLQKILFNKGIDSDTSPEAISEGFSRYRLNVRVMTTDDSEMQSAEYVKGNVEVTYTLPSGSNTVIGSYEDLLQKKNYYFVYNSSFQHSILEYDQEADVVVPVFIGTFLNFSLIHLITGINTVKLTDSSHLLYWTDNFNAPRKLNIEKSKYFTQGNYTLGYKYPFDPEILYRVKQPPLFPPTYVWSGNESTSINIQVITPVQVINQTLHTNFISVTNGVIQHGVNNATIALTQIPVIPAFNNSTHIWTVATSGSYNLSMSVNMQSVSQNTNYGGDVSLFLNINRGGTIINIQLTYNQRVPFSVTNYNYSTPNISLLAGDQLAWTAVINPRYDAIGTFNTYYNQQVRISNATVSASLLATTQSSSTTPNYLLNKLLVIKTRFIYDDYEVSAFSPISNYVLPGVTMDGITEENVILQDNKITISVPTGNSIVKKIDIAVKEYGETAFSIIATLDKEELSIPDNSTYYYDYYGNGIKIPINANDDIKLFDSVPLLSQSQEIIKGERIVDGLITEGFDPVIIDARLSVSYVPVKTPSNTQHYPKYSYLKAGDNYIFGIVYYNHANQSGVTNISDWKFDEQRGGVYGTHLYIPFLNESTYGVQDMAYVPVVNMNISNRPPSWATHFQIVRTKGLFYTKYLQFVANQVIYDTGNPATAKVIKIDISNIYGTAPTSYKSANPNSILTQDIGTNTRIRFIANKNDPNINTPSTFLPFNDTTISSFDPATGYISVPINTASSVLRQLGDGCLFEIYTPSANLTASNVITYECGQCFAINTDAYGNKYHTGSIQSQVINPLTGATISPAIFKIGEQYGGGDTFRRRQWMPHLSGSLEANYFIESENVNNMFYSMASDEGRPNRVDVNYRQVTRPSTVYYSELLIPETFINGLSSVYDTNFETYEQKYGGIYKLFNQNQDLWIFQELKIGSVAVNKIIYNDLQGGNTVGASSQVLEKQVVYSLSEYGIGKHPESFAVYGNSKYGIDVRRGVLWRLSNDGLTPISEYFQHIYITGLCKEILKANSKVNVYGVYDKRFNEYIIAFNGFTYGSTQVPAQTLAFNEKENLYSTHYSFAPENMVSNGVNIITFKNGKLWKHNENTLYNNFYGVQDNSEIHSYCNALPSNIKVFEAISMESRKPMKVIVETPITQENPNGQHTELYDNNFQMKEGYFYSEILKDDFTPNTVVGAPYLPNARFEGRPMRGQYALIKLISTDALYNKIFAVNVQFIGSERSNA